MKYLFPNPSTASSSEQIYFVYGISGGKALVSHAYFTSSTEGVVGLIQYDETTFDLSYANYFTSTMGDNGYSDA